MRDPANFVGVPADQWYGGVIGQVDPNQGATVAKEASTKLKAFVKEHKEKSAQLNKYIYIYITSLLYP